MRAHGRAIVATGEFSSTPAGCFESLGSVCGAILVPRFIGIFISRPALGGAAFRSRAEATARAAFFLANGFRDKMGC